ncbi:MULTISPECIES: bifunctional oligoribonuclease/PAP phosphatase NrnA [Aerococcus]|uniref:Bifunctional oligoribonuclease/PAP phosphatase NrnA n=1 Tax=Aerococcus sanguinicola TaxID=119206 RepID=A0A5N1GQ11_9LACT|nr:MULTISPECIES: bifunctional oligoribonuclease/PAP phosphatase NrnA [Aerococcus]KAA9302131.1 bifunctional oligoribonuclease/PAP phosphatase NrnA [Aerococcus sanguinicola]MDK6368439.1 bifunctional oligoribonuclease/PAP phosphatase NrnA [Aerococcus sp. UMB9870]MDK6679522.1 bifunctional oligoribonuclease/PAP phosphatase NrnA [Aerococcus sp. UMB8608]MDK6686366.1 bifunctional oligoribonuclease/PAP phosphatase NrnA [Aerococcus sp. UMB8623]MDK6941012.1 bifunctional oligoribonuclease/PAP phosphatase 
MEEILQAIEAYDTIIIHRHQRPDPDALGSQLGLKAVLEATYPNKAIYAVGQDEPSLAQFARMDQISDESYQQALVIVNDTANTGRIDDDRYASGDRLVKVDHHPNNEPYGDLSYVDTSASSCSEIWAGTVLDAKNSLQMTDQAAQNFFLGIVGDTGRFLFDNTSPETLSIAGKLLAYDFPASQLMQAAMEISPGQAGLQAYVLDHTERSQDGLVASVSLSQATLRELGLTEAESHSIVQLPGQFHGVLAWVIFVEQEDGTYRCRIRSKGPSINTVAQAFDGGGHPKASGASIASAADQARLVDALHVAARNYREDKLSPS